MNITVQQGEIQKKKAPALVVNLFEGARPGGATGALDTALDGLLSAVIDSGDFSGKRDQVLLLYAPPEFPAQRILVVGLGKQEDFDLEAARRAAGAAAARLQSLGVRRAATVLHGTGAGGLDEAQETRGDTPTDLGARADRPAAGSAHHRWTGRSLGGPPDRPARTQRVALFPEARVDSSRSTWPAGARFSRRALEIAAVGGHCFHLPYVSPLVPGPPC